MLQKNGEDDGLMNIKESYENVTKIASLNGIEVFWLKTEKFKTNSINIFFIDDLKKETASKNALLPAVLRRGCRNHPTFQEIALYLEKLYGASFDCGVTKKGENQIIQFYIDHINDKFTGEQENLFEKSLELLLQIITDPVTKSDSFIPEFVEQEKGNLKNIIENRINDKSQYAVEKCFENMCKDEPFGIYEYGSVEDVMAITPDGLYQYYLSFLKTLPVKVFIAGDLKEENVKKVVERLSSIKIGAVKNTAVSSNTVDSREVQHVSESMNVNQGKLSIGFRTNTSPRDPEYYSLFLYNTILGGGIHSKLFQNVREKASLAYYANSRLEKFKGLMIISSGIAIENKDKAIDIIMEQMKEIAGGNISDYEYDSSLYTIETGVKSMADSQLQMVDFYLGQIIAGSNDTLESLIEKVKKVTKEDVSKISQKIKLDTVYFLTKQ